ncbi:MAG TPA: hypothetical protein PK977_13740 [Chitinophagaceae bacterium]|nr:hypothetical protein [Chitinophagaceae bacterium]HRF19230.1 hypothetical protein [Chitinophagaceae bacterium]
MDNPQVAALIYLQMKNEILLKVFFQQYLGHAEYSRAIAALYEALPSSLESAFLDNPQLMDFRDAVMKIYHYEKNPMED